MKQYNLGPNGAIMTSLNLFATRFDQVLDIVERRAAEGLKHVFFDTPGQIEVFTWSASGMIITETLALKFPTVLLYVVDTPRTTNPTTFMSNMLYACSMLYKTNLPLVLVFNKTDVASADFAMEWINDFEKFQEALDEARTQTYMTSLNRSMGLVLDEFYRNLRAVAVSAATGEGIPELMQALSDAAAEYEANYLPELERRKAIAGQKEAKRQEKDIEKLMKDVAIDKERRAAAAAAKTDGSTSDASGSATAMDVGGADNDATSGSSAVPMSANSRGSTASGEDVDMAANVHRGKAPAVGIARAEPSPPLSSVASKGVVGPGSKVELRGLVAKPELNGKQGVVVAAGEGAAEGRWAVQVDGAAASAKPLALKPDNLRVLP
jgi:GTPase SAR1 family protein